MVKLAYVLILSILALGIFGLLYVVLDHIIDNYVYSWGQDNIIDGNQTAYQVIYNDVWSALPVIVTFAFVFFMIIWAQTREVEFE